MIDWYAQRDDISRLVALVALGLILSPLLKYRPAQKSAAPQELFAIQMVAPPEVVEPPPSPVPPPRQQPALVRPQVAMSAPNAPPRHEEVATANVPTPTPPLEAVSVRPTAPVSPAPPVPHPAGAEDAYVASVRAYLIGIKRYPTGRDASIQRPRGKARIWFVLGRDGQLLSSGIDASSDSMLLDRTALATVQRGGFPAFPETAWSGQVSHRFTVELEFIPAS
ncbi:MAG: TonB family protein [Rhodocyclaceae bacterium]|nr:MAG: TonB family protein [Rhodocyclaceae bacterium]